MEVKRYRQKFEAKDLCYGVVLFIGSEILPKKNFWVGRFWHHTLLFLNFDYFFVIMVQPRTDDIFVHRSLH